MSPVNSIESIKNKWFKVGYNKINENIFGNLTLANPVLFKVQNKWI